MIGVLYVILLVMGLGYWTRRPKLKRLSVEDYPDVPPEKFEKWKRLEIKSIDWLLAATLGVGLVGICGDAICEFMGRSERTMTVTTIMVLTLPAFFLFGVIYSGVHGSDAAKLRKRWGIKWPRK